MKKRTDCDFCHDGEKHPWPHGHTSVTVQSFRFGEAISAPRQGPQSGTALMKLPDGQLCYEGNLGSETRQLC